MPLQEEFERQGLFFTKYKNLPNIILITLITVNLQPGINLKGLFFKPIHLSGMYIAICAIVSLSGLFLALYTAGYSMSSTSIFRLITNDKNAFNTTAAYSVVRHPMHIANFFFWLGPMLLSCNFWFIISFCLIFLIYTERAIIAEEKILRTIFGYRYVKWCKKVPAIFPNLFIFKKATQKFSFGNTYTYVKQKFTSIIIVLSLFVINTDIAEQKVYNYVVITLCILCIPVLLVKK